MSAPHVGPGLCRAARAARRLGVLGGSFDPPHLGHLHMLRLARTHRALDHVLVIPAARPPHKPGRVLAPGEERARLLALLLDGEPGVSIWTVELEREGPSFTVDTLEELRRLIGPGPELFLVLGTDNVPGLPAWHRAEDVLALAEPILVPRRGSEDIGPTLARLAPTPRARLAAGLLEGECVDVSSTELRRLLAEDAREGEPDPAAVFLPAALLRRLRTSGLYRDSR